jgi:large subunit ribosomal protein L18
MTVQNNLTSREKIKYRIRKRVKGTQERPRLVVFRSLNNIYAQLVDDVSGKTICSVSNIAKDVKGSSEGKVTKLEKSKLVGRKIAEKAQDLKIKKVVFDRNGYLYHGRVKAVAEAAREAGLEF